MDGVMLYGGIGEPGLRVRLLELSEPIKFQDCIFGGGFDTYCSQAAINVRCLLGAWTVVQNAGPLQAIHTVVSQSI